MARGVGGRGPANIMKHLKGTSFPISKDDLVSHIKQGPGPDTDDVVAVTSQLPDKLYNSPAEIMHELGKIE